MQCNSVVHTAALLMLYRRMLNDYSNMKTTKRGLSDIQYCA
jgi:hypothetical protein